MERRGFLRGLFGGIVGAGVVVTATPKEIATFAAPLAEQTPIVIEAPAIPVVGCGDHLYNDRGELVAIVTNVHFGNHYTIRAEGVGGFEVNKDRVRLRNTDGIR
jgi:hypothetical protein